MEDNFFNTQALNTETKPEPKKKDNNLSTIFSLIGIIAGIITIIFGFVAKDSRWFTTVSDAEFGADFYTYSYRGIAAVTTNTYNIGHLIQNCFCYLLISMGLFDIAFFGVKLGKYLNK